MYVTHVFIDMNFADQLSALTTENARAQRRITSKSNQVSAPMRTPLSSTIGDKLSVPG
jgi:hypothetical protein